MLPDKLIITEGQWAAIVAEARANPGVEICGLLAGKGARVERVYFVPNTSPTPANRFRMDGRDFIAAYLDIEKQDWELTGIFHSHPGSENSGPSQTDVADANYPDALNLIVSVNGDTHASGQVFQIADGEVQEVPLEVAADTT